MKTGALAAANAPRLPGFSNFYCFTGGVLKMKKRRWYDYLWFVCGLFDAWLFNILFAWLGLVCFLFLWE